MSKNWLKIGFAEGSRSQANLSRLNSSSSLKRRYSRFQPKQEDPKMMHQSRSKRSLVSLGDLSQSNSMENLPQVRQMAWSKITIRQNRNNQQLAQYDKQASPDKVRKSAINILPKEQKDLNVKKMHLQFLKQAIDADIYRLKSLYLEVKIVMESMLRMVRGFCADTIYQINKFQSEAEKRVASKCKIISDTSLQIDQIRNGLNKYPDLNFTLPTPLTTSTVKIEDSVEMRRTEGQLSARSVEKRKMQRDNTKSKASELSEVIQRMKSLLGKNN